jgi:CDP-glucose 4,6-dehydratase
LVTAAYRSSYFNPAKYAEHRVALATARAGNVIGGGDWALDRLVPDMIRAIDRGEPVLVRCPAAVRPWQHVLEPLSGYLMLAEKLYAFGAKYSEGWNFGPYETDAKPVEWMIETITKFWGKGASWKIEGAPQPHEAAYLKLDSSKARAQLGWHPKWNIEQAVEKIVEWHKAFGRGEDMRQLTLSQINSHVDFRN